MKMIRRIDPTEHQIVCGVIDFLENTLIDIPPFFIRRPILSPFDFSPIRRMKISKFFIKITNEGKRSYGCAKYLNQEGLSKGAFDGFLAIPCGEFSGMFLEAKSKKGKLTKEQEEFIFLMENRGYKCVVYRSVDEGIQTIKDYLGITN